MRQRLSARKQGEQDLPPYEARLASEPSQSQGGLWRRRRAQNQCLHAVFAKRLRGKESPRSERSGKIKKNKSVPKRRADLKCEFFNKFGLNMPRDWSGAFSLSFDGSGMYALFCFRLFWKTSLILRAFPHCKKILVSRNCRSAQKAFVFLALLLVSVAEICAQDLSSADGFSQARFFDGNKTREIRVYGRTAQFFYGSRYYNMRLSEEGVLALSSACQKYFSDFEEKKLSRKGKKSQEKYGVFQATIEWGTSRQTLAEYAEVRVAAGYVFAGRSPYFAISIPNSPSEREDASPALFSSGEILLLFSKAQISQFVQALK